MRLRAGDLEAIRFDLVQEVVAEAGSVEHVVADVERNYLPGVVVEQAVKTDRALLERIVVDLALPGAVCLLRSIPVRLVSARSILQLILLQVLLLELLNQQARLVVELLQAGSELRGGFDVRLLRRLCRKEVPREEECLLIWHVMVTALAVRLEGSGLGGLVAREELGVVRLE